jgi:hypothetical protein
MPAPAINLSSSATAPLKRQAKRGGVEPIRHETAPVNDMHKTQILYPVRQALSNDLGIKTGPRRLY